MEIIAAFSGIPELGARLDNIASLIADPVAIEALEKGGAVIQQLAENNVRKLTGALSRDIVVVTRVLHGEAAGQKYVLIGPGWDEENFRRAVQRRGKYANEAPRPDQTTNPGLYGLFLEVGHRAPEHGLSRDLEYKRAYAAARKDHERVISSEFGTLTTPPYPWLAPAFESGKDEALEIMAATIQSRLEGMHL